MPVMHSPPRSVSAREQQDWKIPPCISNGKTAQGYTIPLDKRLAADGRGLQETAINDNFAKMTEALYVAEQNARQVSALPLSWHPCLPNAVKGLVYDPCEVCMILELDVRECDARIVNTCRYTYTHTIYIYIYIFVS